MRQGDLVKMNRHIAQACGWEMPSEGVTYFEYVSACIAHPPQVEDCLSCLQGDEGETPKGLASKKRINREYLDFLRLNCRDVLSGQWHLLVLLHLDERQARYFASLSNDELDVLASRWDGPIFQPAPPGLEAVRDIVGPAMLHHAAAVWVGGALS